MFPCGGDDLVCPTGSVSPIKVQEGFYTTMEWAEGCKPGKSASHLIVSIFKLSGMYVMLLSVMYMNVVCVGRDLEKSDSVC